MMQPRAAAADTPGASRQLSPQQLTATRQEEGPARALGSRPCYTMLTPLTVGSARGVFGVSSSKRSLPRQTCVSTSAPPSVSPLNVRRPVVCRASALSRPRSGTALSGRLFPFRSAASISIWSWTDIRRFPDDRLRLVPVARVHELDRWPGEIAFAPPCRESRLEWWSSSWALWPR